MRNFYKSNVLFGAVIALVMFLICLDVYMFRENAMLFWSSLPVLLLVSGLAIGKLVQIRNSENWYFEQLTNEIKGSDSMSLISFPLPVAIVDRDRCVIWSNKRFDESFYAPTKDESSIDLVTEEPLELFGTEGREIEYSGRYYRVYSHEHRFFFDEHRSSVKSFLPEGRAADDEGAEHKEKITMLIFKDITDFRQLFTKYEQSKPVAMIVMVDNYEELLSGAKESERASVQIQVDRLVEEYFAEKNAVMRKISGDKFLIVLERQYLRQMMDEKMAIINKAHEIMVKERTAVTLSIGVGDTAETLAESERFATDMLDKALERGGDQALVKTDNGFTAFGATTSGRERTGKVKIRLAAENIKRLLSTADSVYIMGHSYGDFDSAGAAIGLTCALRRMGFKSVYTVARFRDESKTNAKSLFDRFREYNPPVVIEPEEARNFFYHDKSVLIIVDTHIIKRVEDQELFEMADKSHLVVIDHHRLSAGAITDPAVKLHESSASSASELVTELVQYFSSDALLTPLEAEALLAGIMLDTRDFVMRSGVSTFEAAAYLKKLGADTISVKKLFDTSIESKMRRSAIIASAKIYNKCAVAVVEENFPGLRVICSQAADEMLYIKNVDASFTLYPIEGGWSVSARSLGKVNVQVIMESLGNKKDDGGGHQTMAGAQLWGVSRDEAEQKLHEALDEYFAPAKTDEQSE